ncbi:MAG: hypothetical protein IPG04_15425 [Polyangiaceae bacterium]|nr:hypothetical protein [Polyangiaceae bacterium]
MVIQSSSAAGKSSLMDAVLSLMPEEERVQYSAMTGQSLFYMSGQDLKHKVLAIVEEEGAERASYALKLLQSEGELTIASTGKDPATGRLVTHTYRVEGPVSIMLTTTAIEVDEELPPQTRRLLGEIATMVEGRMAQEGVERRLVRFSRREVREWSGWSQTQVKLHMERLEALEYLVPYRMRGPLVVYELAYAAGADLGTTGPWSGSAGAMSGSAGAMSGGDRAMIPRMSGDERGVERAPNGLKRAANGASSYSRSEFTLQVPGAARSSS